LTHSAILILFNPAARGGKSHLKLKAYTHYLVSQKLAFTIYETNGTRDAEDLALRFHENNYTAVSIIGGDGTLNLALNCLPHLDIPIHLIPAGSGNDFAKMLALTQQDEEVFEKIRSYQKTTSIDLWSCNGRKFINVFGVGFDGELAKSMHGKTSWIPTTMKYWIAIARHVFRYRSKNITLNGKPYSSFMLCAANGRVFGGDFNIAPHADAQDGLLELLHIKKVNVLQRLLYLPKVKKGKHLHLNVVNHTRHNTITIEAKHTLAAQLDGEPMLASRFDIRFERKVNFVS